MYKPVVSNARKHLKTDFYDETSFVFQGAEGPDALTSTQCTGVPRLQTAVRISWLRSILRDYLLVSPKDNYNQVGLSEFSIMSNSNSLARFNLLQKKYALSSILNTSKFLQFLGRKSSIFSGKPYIGLYH